MNTTTYLAHVTVSFDLALSTADIASLLMREQMAVHPALAAAVAVMDRATGIDPVEAVTAVNEQPAPTAAAEPPPAASSRAARARAPAASNGATTTAPAPPPAETAKALPEPEMRALLTRVSSTHPAKVAQVVAILQEHGGHKRLAECPPETWPAIAAAAEEAILRATTGG
jgi:hypothetical protein